MDAEFEFTTGYVGSLGRSFEKASGDKLEGLIAQAATFNSVSADAIREMLAAGQAVKWCKSPNYYYDHSYGVIRAQRSAPQPKLVRCACGHSTSPELVMSTSSGSSCPDCYDRMSE